MNLKDSKKKTIQVKNQPNNDSKIPRQKLKLFFNDILRGYTVTEPLEQFHKKPIYIKHFTVSDTVDFDDQYELYFNSATKQGCLTIAEKESYLIADGSWSEQKNERIQNIKSFLDGLYQTKSKLFRESELTPVNYQIEKYEKELEDLEKEKTLLLDITAETFASKKLNEYYIYSAFYKTKDLDASFFSFVEFNELDNDELNNLVITYNSYASPFSDVTLRRIALSNFFLNMYFLCGDSVLEFYGKPATQLTFYQAELFGHAKYFKNLMSNHSERPPAELFDDPVRFVEFYEGRKTVEKMTQDGKGPESLVGLTSKDKERLGINSTGEDMNSKLVAEAMRKGGSLCMSDIMKLSRAG